MRHHLSLYDDIRSGEYIEFPDLSANRTIDLQAISYCSMDTSNIPYNLTSLMSSSVKGFNSLQTIIFGSPFYNDDLPLHYKKCRYLWRAYISQHSEMSYIAISKMSAYGAREPPSVISNTQLIFFISMPENVIMWSRKLGLV